MNELTALIFDVDGTLADTERDGHRVAFNRAFAEAGLDWEWSVGRYGALLAVTGGKERIGHYIDQFRPELRSQTPDLDGFIARLHAAKTRHYLAMLEGGAIPLRPGVRRFLTEARSAGVRLAIATTTSPENVTALLRHSLAPDASDWFEVIAAGDIVAAKKPAPDIYTEALDRLGLDSGACLAFEDSRNGLLAAHGAGLATVVSVNDYTRGEDFAGAALVVDGFGEPDAPWTVLAGKAGGAPMLDLAVARHVHARCVLNVPSHEANS